MPADTRSRLERFLGVFADVRAGEGTTVLLLTLNIWLLLQAYYVLKPVREALILGQGSPELKSYLSVADVALLMVAVPLYARLVAALPRLRLIRTVTWFFVGCLVVFYLLAQLRVPLGIVYFLWIEVFNLMIVSQFWAFANDIYTKDEGERLFPIVGFGASLGAVVGAVAAERLIGPVGVYQLMLVGAAGLVLQLEVTSYIDRRERRRLAHQPQRHAAADHPAPPHNAFGLVLNSRYLLSIGLMIFVLYQVEATGEYILGTVIKRHAIELVASGQSGGIAVEALIGQFYSRYFALVNIGSLVIQLFIVSRAVKYLGVGIAVCLLPALSILVFGSIAAVPSLAVIAGGSALEKATDYSLSNTVRNMLFLPCTREEKYSAKQVIDSLFVRLGNVMSAVLVFCGTTLLGLGVAGFASATIVLAAIALVLAIIVGRIYGHVTADSGRAPVRAAATHEVPRAS